MADIGRGVRGAERRDLRSGDGNDLVEPIESVDGLFHVWRDGRRGDPIRGRRLERRVRRRQEVHRLAGIAIDEIHPGPEDPGQVVLGGLQRRLAGVERSQVRRARLAAKRPDGRPQSDPDHHEREDRHGGSPLRLALGRGRGHPAVGRSTPRQEVLEAKHDPSEDPASGSSGADRRGLDGRDAVRHVVGERDRRAVRCAGEGLRWAHRHERPVLVSRGHLGGLQGDHRVTRRPVGGHEPVMEVLHRRLRVERDHGVLQLVRPELRHDVRRDEDERVADGDLAAPDVGLQVVRRETALAMRIGKGRQPRLADEVGLGRADRPDV